MKTTSLDLLENAELPSAQAHAILKIMELEMASAHESLATRVDLLALRGEMKAEFQQVRAEMKGIEGGLSRWVLTCILGQTAILAGFGYFVLTHLRR